MKIKVNEWMSKRIIKINEFLIFLKLLILYRFLFIEI